MSINRAEIFGNVANDPEVRDVNGVKVASFRVATSEKYTDRNGEKHENTEWHSIVAWRNLADLAEKFIHKGDKLYVEGKLKTRKYTDKNGVDRQITEIFAEKVEFTSRGVSQAAPAVDDMPGDVPF